MADRADVLRAASLAAFGGLVATIFGVAVVAMVAESYATWEWYFRMERAIAFARPLASALFVLSLAGGGVIVALAPRD
ncbi:hypothetical protein [Salinirarus marinus]|uniref:hypothetical protein n=1 Tax=Salinirarus marinus TaxID=3068310 RepID=UPI003C6C4142